MSTHDSGTDYRLDEIDRRILHALMGDARGTSAPTIAEKVSVSPATIRNRIRQLEDHGIIQGYRTSVDFERADGSLTYLYQCNVPVDEREALARKVGAIPGVINVRQLMTGKRNLHVMAVGPDTATLRRIGRALAELGIEIEDEDLVQNERSSPYGPYGPDDSTTDLLPADFISLTGDASVVELTVDDEAPVIGHTLAEASKTDLLPGKLLVVAIERDGTVLTPRGDTTIEADDVVTVLSREEIDDDTLTGFRGSASSPKPN